MAQHSGFVCYTNCPKGASLLCPKMQLYAMRNGFVLSRRHTVGGMRQEWATWGLGGGSELPNVRRPHPAVTDVTRSSPGEGSHLWV